MTDRKKYALELMQKYSFSEQAIAEILSAYDKIYSCDKAKELFEQQIKIYEHDMMFYFRGALDHIRNAADISNVRQETALLLYVICLTEHLKFLYDNKGYDKKMFDGVICDIKAKNQECYAVCGIHGTFSAEWFERFFNLTQFVLGRLQFEPIYLFSDIIFDDKTIKKDTFAIAIHIPSGRALNIDECRESLEEAYDMFSPLFGEEPVMFYCGSWLLAPDNKKLLSPNSNIVKFMDFFRIVPTEKTIEHDFWRIFGKEDCSDIKSLPRDNSLRRIYAECAEKGEIPLSGCGIFYMKDKKIIH